MPDLHEQIDELRRENAELRAELAQDAVYLLRIERYALLDAAKPGQGKPQWTPAQEQRLAELDVLCEAAMPVHYREHEDYYAMKLIRDAAALIRLKGL